MGVAQSTRRMAWALVLSMRWLAFAWLGVAGMVNPAWADGPMTRFGLIEIGGSGVKASVVELGGGDSAPVLKVIEKLQVYNFNVSAVDSVPAVAQAVGQRVRDLADQYKLDPLHIYVVADGGVAGLGHAETLRQAVDQAAAGLGGAMSFITSQDQARLGFNGVVNCRSLAHRRAQVLYIDIGSAETIFASAEAGAGCGQEAIGLAALGFGVKSLTRQLEGLEPSPRLLRIEEEVRAALRAAPPGVLTRERIYLGGGIVWTLASWTHPEISTDFLQLTAGDIERLSRQLEADPSCILSTEKALVSNRDCVFLDLNFLQLTPANRRWEAINRHREIVTSIYSPEQLRTGIALLRALAAQLNFAKKTLFFANPSADAWLLGFVLEREGFGARAPEALVLRAPAPG